MAETPVLLVNALRHREEVYVLRDGKPVLLPRAAPPTVVSRPHGRSQATIAVPADADDPAAGLLTTTVGVEHGESDLLVLGDLPRAEHVWYLVDPLVKIQFPHRDDFVVPATYGYWTSKRLAKALASKDKKVARKARKRDLEAFSHAKRFPLNSVGVGPVAVTGPDTRVLRLDDLDD